MKSKITAKHLQVSLGLVHSPWDKTVNWRGTLYGRTAGTYFKDKFPTFLKAVAQHNRSAVLHCVWDNSLVNT